jgi:hypothetical protein
LEVVMEKRHNIYGGAILILAVLTCMSALKVTGVGFLDRVELCYYAFLGGAAVAAVFFLETSIGMNEWPVVRMKVIWPIALVFVWASFHEVLYYSAMYEPVTDNLGRPMVTGFEPDAWYTSDIVYFLGALAILAYGYFGDRVMFAEQ